MKKLFLFFVLISAFGYAGIADHPWIAPKAAEFLDQYLQEHPDANVLEYGSGASTIWIAKRTRNLYSVEHHQGWYENVLEAANSMPECHEFEYAFLKTPYYNYSDQFEDEFFDVVFVDGRNRKGCIAHSVRKLKPGGLLILDDGERRYYHAVFPLMKGWKGYSSRRSPGTRDPCVTYWWVKPLS